MTPAISPIKTNNPGVSILTIDDSSLKPQNIESHFFLLNKYLEDNSIDEWHTVNYQEDFGVTDLTPEGIHLLKTALDGDKDATLNYLIQKVGYMPEDAALPI